MVEEAAHLMATGKQRETGRGRVLTSPPGHTPNDWDFLPLSPAPYRLHYLSSVLWAGDHAFTYPLAENLFRPQQYQWVNWLPG
jgi:hypothetical protein